MRFNPQNVIIMLSAVFNALDFPESPIMSEELIMEENERYVERNIWRPMWNRRRRIKCFIRFFIRFF